MKDHELVTPTDGAEWRAYHDIRRRVLFEARGQFDVYQEDHPDERALGNYPKLLLYRGEPVGVVRIDVDATIAFLRRVAIRSDVQRLGHGRMLLTLAQQFAHDLGCERLASFVAPEAVEFYERCGFTVDGDPTFGSSGRQSVFMTKDLKSPGRKRSAMEGIHIRPYEPDDSAGLYAAALESVADVFPWLPWCHPGYSLAEAEEWTRSRPLLFKEGTSYDFVIADSSGRFLGACGLNQINRDHRFANLGYWVRSSDTGRGLASAAVGHLAEFAFSQTDILRLEIICDVGNTRSQRAAEKSGATREGVLRDRLFLHGQSHDAVVYSIVRSKWKAV